MNQQASQSTTMAAIIRPMFIALPAPRGVEVEDLLRGYLIALDDLPLDALKSVVIKLVKGTWHEEVKFCPRPPELANMVRDEQRRIDLIKSPRLPAPAANKPFKDIRVTQRLSAEELQKAGYVLHARCESHEAFATLAKRRQLPVGATHLWAIDEIWAPKQVQAAAPIKPEINEDFYEEYAA